MATKTTTVTVGSSSSTSSTSSVVMAKWANKKWQISSDSLTPIDNLTYAMTYDTDEGTKDKRTLKAPYTLYKEFGDIDIASEIDNWYPSLGCKAPFYIGKTRFGPSTWQLIGVSILDLQVSDSGVIRKATIELSFEEP